MLRARFIALAALLALALALPAASALASGQDVIRDCTDDEVLSKTYTQKEYKDALAELASDSDQYGNCRDVIKRAQLQALRDARAKKNAKTTPGAAAPTGGGGFGNPPAAKQLDRATPVERAAVDNGRKTALTAVDVQGAAVKPGIGSASDIPTPLLILLALVLAGALALAATRIRGLVLARRA